jgi:hypothetical protein
MHDLKYIRPLALLVPVLLLGCAEPAPAPAPEPMPAPPGECAVEPARLLEGKAFDAEVQAQAQRLSGARAVRVIRPGQAVTMDFNPFRLNIELDASDRVLRVRCG